MTTNSQPDQPFSRSQLLALRSQMWQETRSFFYERQFLEVETPLLANQVIPELHIEPIPTASPLEMVTRVDNQQPYYLQASPELFMKTLLSAETAAIFQITRSFRRGESGPIHRPEFTMLEWYRCGDDMREGMRLLDALAQHLLSTPAAKITTYRDAFQKRLGLDPFETPLKELIYYAQHHSPLPPTDIDANDRDEWLNFLLATQIEPHLGKDRPEILYHYPASQSALARTTFDCNQHCVAERFELYIGGVELANGYHELTEPDELRTRFAAVNRERLARNRSALPLPTSLLDACEAGIPDATGVAVGMDRLLMVRMRRSELPLPNSPRL